MQGIPVLVFWVHLPLLILKEKAKEEWDKTCNRYKAMMARLRKKDTKEDRVEEEMREAVEKVWMVIAAEEKRRGETTT